MQKVKIKENQNFVRDINSMAILNVDESALAKDRMYREKIKREQEIDNALNSLRDDVGSVKIALTEILKTLEILKGRGQ